MSSAAPLSAAGLAAWLEQSHDLLALTDAGARIVWSNPAFERAAGIGAGADLLSLAPRDWQDGTARAALERVLRGSALGDAELALRGAAGATLWVQPRVAQVDEGWLWTLRDTTATREFAQRAQHQAELLDMAQEFGRLGVWEREIPSGRGHWDRHVFGFWGLDADTGTPDYAAAAARIHPDDQTSNYLDSTRRAGRYAQRYRVVQPDGSLRWIHSQWEVKNSPRGIPERTIGIMVDDTEVYELARSRDTTAAQLKLAVDLGRIVIFRHDLRAHRLHFNENGYSVLGLPYRADGLSLDELRSYIHPDDLKRVQASVARSLQTDEPVDVENRYRRSDGSWRYLLVRRVVERDPSGEPVAFVGVGLDVTDQVEHTRRAEHLALRLEAAAEAARVGIWSATLGTDETEWNAQMYRLFDIDGTPPPPTRAQWLAAYVHPDDRSARTTIQRSRPARVRIRNSSSSAPCTAPCTYPYNCAATRDRSSGWT